MNTFSSQELKIFKKLKSPEQIQIYLDSLKYNLRDTAFSPRLVIRHQTAHCLEGAAFAAAALEYIGHQPLIMDLEAEYDSDHVLAVFKQRGYWGAIGKSNFTGLRFRAPVYKNFRELALSYFNDYFNLKRQRTLRRYSESVNLKKFDSLNWRTTEKNIWFIAEHLCEISHKEIAPARHLRKVPRVDLRQLGAGKLGMRV